MGKNRFAETCVEKGLEVERRLTDLAVDSYRESHPAIVAYWDTAENACKEAIRNPNTVYTAGPVKVASNGRWLFCRLPSGRTITYPMPLVKWIKKDFGHWKEVETTNSDGEVTISKVWIKKIMTIEAVTYMGINTAKQWVRKDTWGGSLAENWTQGIARDIMCEAQLRVKEAGFETLFSVHDEIISEAQSDDRLEEYESLMTQVPKWAGGLPVGSEGMVCKRFRK
jgi:DNA polymerase